MMRRVVVLLIGLALVAAACGNDDTTATQATAPLATEAPASTEAPAPSTTVAPTTTEAMALTPEQVIADFMVPLPPNTELVSVDEMEDGAVVSMIVNSPPPPNYAAVLAGTDWEVLDVLFSSETTIAFYDVAAFCMIAYANYDGATDPNFWMHMYFDEGLTREDCLEAAAETILFLNGLGRPS